MNKEGPIMEIFMRGTCPFFKSDRGRPFCGAKWKGGKIDPTGEVDEETIDHVTCEECIEMVLPQQLDVDIIVKEPNQRTESGYMEDMKTWKEDMRKGTEVRPEDQFSRVWTNGGFIFVNKFAETYKVCKKRSIAVCQCDV
jgi:hypothetical protein